MPDVQEVFRLATQKVRPEPGFVDRQFTQQRRRSRNRKVGALAIAAAFGLVAVVVVIRAIDDGTGSQPGGRSKDTNTTQPVPVLPGGAVEPGRYLLTPDPTIDASYAITMEVPSGYVGGDETWILNPASTQTGLLVMTIGDVHADACQWRGTRTAVSSTDEAVAALTSQQGIRTSAPIDVTLDGFAGTYMERTVPAGANLSDCDQLEFRTWVETGGGPRYLGGPGQVDLLWIVDVDGAPLVIDVALDGSASAQDRADLEQIVESIRIDPR